MLESITMAAKKLSVFDTFCLGLNAIIGSGIFIFPALLAKKVGPASILAFAVCGLLLVFVALGVRNEATGTRHPFEWPPHTPTPGPV